MSLYIDDAKSTNGKFFYDTMESYGLLQHVNAPTHQKGHMLDLLFTRELDNLVSNIAVHDTQLSDHYWVLCELNVQKPKPSPKVINYRKLNDIDIESFRSDIVSSGIGKPKDSEDIITLVDSYNSVLAELLEKHAPLKSLKVTVRDNAPWYTSDIKEAKRVSRRWERRWRSSGLTVHKDIYRASLDYVSTLIEKSKKEYYSSKFDDIDQKSVYKLANTILHKPKDMALPIHDSATKLATLFNDFFVKKIINLRKDLQDIVVSLPASLSSLSHPVNITSPDCSPIPVLDSFDPTTEQELRKIIMSTKSTQCSLDPVPTKLLKDCIDVLLPILTKIVNLSLANGVMPDCLKKALVIPLVKKLNLSLENLKNFRPVSNLAYLSKLIERVVARRLISHMDMNKLHELLQSSYKKFHSCETALIKVQDDILKAIDNKKCVLLILLDLSAAFDTVDHHRLVQVLSERLGLTGTALKWFQNYLSSRIQSVIIDGKESDVWNILFGVPQGSVLGPILFIIYTSPLGDILRHHNISYHLYADDTQMYLSFNVNESAEALSRLELCISDIRAWMATNFLHLNDSKTELLLIGSKNMLNKIPDIELKIGNDKVVPANSARNIGAIFDEALSMTAHVAYMCKNAWFHLRRIGEIRPYLDVSSTSTLMHSFVSSRLDTFNALLYGIPQQQLLKLQRVQNAAARVVTKSRKYDHITPILKELHWLPIAQRIEYKLCLLVFKALHGLAPVYLQELVQVSKQSRNLRSNSLCLLQVPKSSTAKYGDRAFSHAGPSLWNKLPVQCRNAKTITTFKSRLKTYLYNKAFEAS